MKNDQEIRLLCDKALAEYDFGDGVNVVETSGWEYVSNSAEITCPIFLQFDEDDAQADSHLGTFSVTIIDNKIVQADCSCEGNFIGKSLSIEAQ